MPCKSVAVKPGAMEKAVAKVAEKLVAAANVVAIKLAAIAGVDHATETVLADRVMEMATVLVDHVLLAKAMATVRNAATAPSVVIADLAKAVVVAPASVVQVVVDLLKVSDQKAALVVLVPKRCSHVSTKMAMAN
ncbi:hypothetical protein [Aeoliella sp. SH292]|uniref:hypothetical protein n=1 Tax=Aeoliella sp. SH292 TaxID=3454464 RepID=UPI003F9892B1